MFENLEALPEDSILGLTAAYRDDPRTTKIDLGVGVYKLGDGTTPIMHAVKRAERIAADSEQTKSYLPPTGYPGFGDALTRLVFGSDHASVEAGRVRAVQTPGGCGALRLAGDLLVRRGAKRIHVGHPTWANHIPLMKAAGLAVELIPYFNRESCMLEFEQFTEHLCKLGPDDIVLLHGACHNPTGTDFSTTQWKAVTEIALERGFLPFIDTAYHGFARDLVEDVAPIRAMALRVPEMLISYSCSKNFGLYRERTGALLVLAKTSQRAAAVQSHITNVARGMYSMPPSHGAAIVTTILQSAELTALWLDELMGMSLDMRAKRIGLVETARKHRCDNGLGFIADQHGMFSLLPINPEQVQALRRDHGIYMTNDGRINICGLTSDNMDDFCRAYKSVL